MFKFPKILREWKFHSRVCLPIFSLVATLAEVPAIANEVQGVFGMGNPEYGGYFAVRVDVPENDALSGFRWYNNDGEVLFLSVKIGTGHPQSPGDISEFVTVSQDFQGESSAWSELNFSEPVGASLGSLYLALEYPVGQELTGIGEAGGAGIGYLDTDNGCRGWLSSEGVIWASLDTDFSFAVQPVFVPFEDGMTIKSLADPENEMPDIVIDNYLNASPNPFNPVVQISFGLRKAGEVELAVFDLRGRLVLKLSHGFFEAGHHSLNWNGSDSQGRKVSSGVYFARINGSDIHLNRKILLVK